MAEYIEREEAIKNIKEHQCRNCSDIGLCGNCAVLTAIKLFENIPAVDVQPVKWIPVTERLPDFEGMCLCMRKSYSKAKFRHQEIMYFDYDEQAFCSNADGVFVAYGNVTHWMPLPKPPKDGET